MKSLLLSALIGLVVSCSSAEDELAEKGGQSFLLSVQPREDEGGNKIPFTEQEMERAMRVIEGRLEGMGIAKILVAREGGDGIRLKVPGVDAGQASSIVDVLEKTSRLGLHEVNPLNNEVDADGVTLAQRVLDGDQIVPGYRAYIHKLKDEEGNDFETPILLNRRTAVSGEDIDIAVLSPIQADAVNITLNGKGTEKMIALTKNMRPHLDRIAIVLDGEVVTAPVIMATPLGKNFVINGLNKPGEAKALALALMHPLETPLKVLEVSSIFGRGR